jgi:nicotinate phosphoribosyltransferase
MKATSRIYRTNLTLLTDLYQLTMAYGYWKTGMYKKESVFHLFFRKSPFKGNYAIACGLAEVVDYLKNIHFSEDDVSYLGSLKGADGKQLFEEGFLNFLQRWEFQCDVDAVEEGTIVFPNEPLIRVKGPLWQAQLLETTMLNMINFSTLIATKASRVVAAAEGDTVLEFGLRRAQGADGGITASKSAYIGGCHATSNVLAGKLFGIPVKGTHAHSWVMSFETELEAFEALAETLPNNCTFLVDTYNTVEGVKNAILTGTQLRISGHDLMSIRLDSGDLAQLSIHARQMLDEAGFQNTKIVASNDLDEYSIRKLKSEGARIDIWGVGTHLVTAYDQPALGGVYKLSAIENTNSGTWDYKVKKSEELIKVSNPGIQEVRRILNEDGKPIKDIIFDRDLATHLPNEGVDILKPIFKNGKLVYKTPSALQARKHATEQIQLFEGVLDTDYPVELEAGLLQKKKEIMGLLVSKITTNQS